MTDGFRVIPQGNGVDELIRVVNCLHDRIDSVTLPQNGASTTGASYSNVFGSMGAAYSEPGASYALPVASPYTLGGVKIGDGVSVNVDGTISVAHNGLSDLQDANGAVSGQHYHLNAAQAGTVYQLSTAAPSSDGLGLYGNTDGTFYFSAPIIYAGVVTQPSYTDNGDGSVTIGSGVYNLYPDPTGAGLVKQYALLGGTFTLTDGITNYIYADYNSGSPLVKVTTNPTDFFGQYFTSTTPIYTLYRSGTNIYELNFDTTAHASPEKTLYRLLDTRRFEHVSGMSLADAGNGTFTVTQGVVWYAITRTTLDAFSSSTDSTYLYYYDGSSWAYNAVTGYNNTNYQGPSGLPTLPGGKYNVNWVYRSISSSKTCFIVLGSAAYTLNDAIAAQPPGNVPDVVSTTAMLVGKIIVSQGAASSSAVYSAFDVQYSGGVSSGTVTSVGLSLPAIFTVTNSPVTASGTLTATFASQTGNTFLAAPNAADGVPSMRTIVLSDISAAMSTWAGSTALTTVGTVTTGTWNGTKIADSYINSASTWNGKQTAYTILTTFGSLTNASGFLKNNGSGTLSYANPVTSVGLSLPSIFTVSGSPVTTTGTLKATFASQTRNTFLAAPNGSAGVPAFRAPLAADISNSTTAGRALLTAADVPAQRTALGVVADALVAHLAGAETFTGLKKISFNAADISTIDSGTQLQLVGADGGVALLEIIAAGATASPYTVYRQMRGTLASPTATKSGDAVGTAVYRGRAATEFTNTVAYVLVAATEDYTDAANGTQMVFSTTRNGTNASRAVGSWGQDGVLTANYGIDCQAIAVYIGPKTTALGQGGTLRLRDDSGVNRWLVGLLGTNGARNLSVYDMVNGAERVRVDATSGVVSVPCGINLGGSANLTAYDEGTWTPTVTALGGTGITYSAKWTKIGNRVDFNLGIFGTGLTSSAAYTFITLPFTPARMGTCGVCASFGSQPSTCSTNTAGKIALPTLTSTTEIYATGTIFLN